KSAGVQRPDVMTRMELVDEILRLSTRDPVERKRARGLLGVARDLLASVVEQGLNLPDAAAFIRGEVAFEPRRPAHGPVATVTRGESSAAQGHLGRALAMRDEVVSKEPEHEAARKRRDRLQQEAAVSENPPTEAPDASPPASVAPDEDAAPPVSAAA